MFRLVNNAVSQIVMINYLFKSFFQQNKIPQNNYLMVSAFQKWDFTDLPRLKIARLWIFVTFGVLVGENSVIFLTTLFSGNRPND